MKVIAVMFITARAYSSYKRSYKENKKKQNKNRICTCSLSSQIAHARFRTFFFSTYYEIFLIWFAFILFILFIFFSKQSDNKQIVFFLFN